MAEIPVNGDTVRWALAEAGLTPTSAAEHLGLQVETVEAWLRDETQPNTTQLRKLAKYVGRSPQFLLGPTPQSSGSSPTAFRRPIHLTSTPFTESEIEAIRDARRTQELLKWLASSQDIDGPSLPRFSLSDQPEAAAEEVRQWLPWSTNQQTTAKSSSAAANQLRRTIEERSIAVLHYSMEPDGYRGFSLADDVAPIIVANTKQRVEARIFTYSHELAHLVLGSSEVCDLRASNTGIEAWCDSFSGAFLLERRPLSDYVRTRFDGFVTNLDDLKTVANKFKISMSATAIRLKDLGLGSSSLYGAVSRTIDFAKASGGFPSEVPNDRPRIRFLKYGSTVTRALDDAVSAGTLQPTDALSYLRISRSEFDTIRQLVGVESL